MKNKEHKKPILQLKVNVKTTDKSSFERIVAISEN